MLHVSHVYLQVCIDLFVLSQAYSDIATLSTLSHTTSGSLYHYCPFNPVMDQDQVLNDLKWNVSRPQVGVLASLFRTGRQLVLAVRQLRTGIDGSIAAIAVEGSERVVHIKKLGGQHKSVYRRSQKNVSLAPKRSSLL